MEHFRVRGLVVPFFVATRDVEANELLELLRRGATDFITPPLEAPNVLVRLWRSIAPHRDESAPSRRLHQRIGLKRLIGEAPEFTQEIEKIPLVARCDVTVLICGESGTGKELVARAVHYLSPRSSKPFVPVSCGAIPVELAESELFGHQEGAFTGASARHRGLIEEAQGGTVFLDDVECLPPLLQAKLLRFIQEKEFRVLGSSRLRRADVRVVTASNCSLYERVKQGSFRLDLFYRLNVVSLNLPPLRRRSGDIPLLAASFLQKYAPEFGRPVPSFSQDAMQKLLLHQWPGNVRELEHVIEGAVILGDGTTLTAGDLLLPDAEGSTAPPPFREAKASVVARFESRYIRKLLLAYRGNVTRAAQAAGKNRRAFFELMRKHSIEARRYRNAT